VILARPTKSFGLYCLNLETEVLAPTGFHRWNEIDVSDEIAGFNPQTEEISWVPVTGKIVRPLQADEHMVHLYSVSIDLRVSDHHRMVYRPRRHGTRQWKIREAQELKNLNDTYHIPVAGIQNAPGVPLSDDELRFIGWFLTDGTLNRSNNVIQI